MISRGAVVAFLVALAALQFASVANPGKAAAADPPARLQFDAEQRDDGSWMLRATLTRAGAVQSQETVQFLRQVDFFGQRRVPIGTAVTDAAGVASLLYWPTSNRAQRLIARHAAEDGTFDSDPFDITVRGAAPAIPGEPPVLPVVRAWAFPVGAAILFLVWLFLAVILLRAVIGIARPAPMQAPSTGSPDHGRQEPSPQPTSSTE